MNEVSVMAIKAAIASAKIAKLPLSELVAGLPFDAQSLRHKKRVDWDDYTTFLERIQELAGGPEALAEMGERVYHDAVPPELRTVLRSFVSPRLLLRFILKVDRSAFSNIDFPTEELTDGRLRVTSRLHAHSRPCLAFFWSSLGAFRGLPIHLGLPPAEAEVEELTDRALVVRVRLPESRTLVARANRLSLRALQRAAVRVIGDLSAEQRISREHAVRQLADIGALGRELSQHIDLPSLAEALRAMLVKLGWTRVALWVLPLDQEEAQLLTRQGEGFDRILPLSIAGRDVGRLEVGGDGDEKLLAELVPWISISIDNARTFAALLRRRAPLAERLSELEQRLELTPRQSEVLSRLVQGMTNKEIAGELCCAENTVEYHVTQLMRRVGAQSRAQLIARFWAV